VTKEIVKVPDLGGADGVEVIEICVAVGDQVALEDSLVVLETDKASMEVPSPLAGTVLSINVSDGDSLSEGDVILEMETETETETAAVSDAPVATETIAAPAPEVVAAPAEPAPVTVSATSIEVVSVPDIGGAENVDVIEVCVSAGDEIAEGDSMVVLETDKSSMEVPAPMAGKVLSVAVKEGDVISEGGEILQIEVVASAAPVTAAVAAPAESVAAAAPVASSGPVITEPAIAKAVPSKSTDSSIYAGPAVRRLAREMGVELTEVGGSGPRGRVSKDDLKSYVKTALTAAPTKGGSGAGIPAIPAIDFSQFGEITVEPLTKIHKLTAHNMQRNWLNVPHVTQFDDANITELEDFRKGLKAEAERRGLKITPMPFLVKACAKALSEHPKFNASLHEDGEQMVYKHYINIGIAVDTPAGLVVPVIRDADKKSIWALAAEIAELADKAKNRKLKPADMQGGCFSISSLGGIGGLGFTPIVNAPEVAILGVSRLTVKPLWNGSEFVPAKMLPLSLSYDHRAINGGDAGRFFTYLADVLGDIRKMVM
jgi:pyruvate dehydrogenase E2 component (dihydrolipoamide acetyltransferase)